MGGAGGKREAESEKKERKRGARGRQRTTGRAGNFSGLPPSPPITVLAYPCVRNTWKNYIDSKGHGGCQGLGGEGPGELPFNGGSVSVLQNEEHPGDGCW